MSNQSLAVTSASNELEVVDENLLVDYLQAMGLAQKLTPAETNQFLQIAKAYKLNPFKREIYATKYGEGQYAQFSIIVGYEVYLKRAERSGKLNGWKVEFTNYNDGELSATITIYRKDWDRPFEWEVFYSEQVQKKKDGSVTAFWQKKHQQLRKVAISQGMRLAFPDENGGLPYTSDEMPEVQETTHEVIPEHSEKAIEAKVKNPTKRETAEEMKRDQRFKEYEKNITLCADDTSFNANETYIVDDKVLSDDQKLVLIKLSIMQRTNSVTTVEEAEAVKVRIGRFAKAIGNDNTVALLNDLIEQAATNGVKYENKKFYAVELEAEEEVENEQ